MQCGHVLSALPTASLASISPAESLAARGGESDRADDAPLVRTAALAAALVLVPRVGESIPMASNAAEGVPTLAGSPPNPLAEMQYELVTPQEDDEVHRMKKSLRWSIRSATRRNGKIARERLCHSDEHEPLQRDTIAFAPPAEVYELSVLKEVAYELTKLKRPCMQRNATRCQSLSHLATSVRIRGGHVSRSPI